MKNIFSINPVALRELRQLVRSKIITVSLAIFPAILLVFTLLSTSNAMGDKPPEEIAFGDGLGENPFTTVAVITGLVACLGIPFYAAIKAIMETKRNGTGLEFTTALTPANIVGGRLTATAILIGATVATATPFFIFAYLLRGIPLDKVFLVPLGLFAYGLSIFAASLSVAYRPGPVALRIIITVLLDCFAFIFTSISMIGLAFAGGSEAPSAIKVATCVVVSLATVLVFFRAYCASLLAPPHVDGERPFRRVVFALFLISSPLAFYKFEPWSITWMTISGVLLLQSALSPRDIPRAARGAAPSGFLRRLFAFPFTTGAVPGMLFALLTMIASGAVYTLLKTDTDDIAGFWALIAELTFAPILVGSILRRIKAHPRVYRIAGWIMIGLFIFISISSSIARAGSGGRHSAEMVPCNISGINEDPVGHFHTYGIILLAWSLIIIVASSVSAFRRYRRQ